MPVVPETALELLGLLLEALLVIIKLDLLMNSVFPAELGNSLLKHFFESVITEPRQYMLLNELNNRLTAALEALRLGGIL